MGMKQVWGLAEEVAPGGAIQCSEQQVGKDVSTSESLAQSR